MATKKLSTVLLLLVIATIAVVDVEPKKRHHHRQHKTKLEFLNGERKQNVLLAPVPDIGYFKFPTDQEPSPLNQQVHQAAMGLDEGSLDTRAPPENTSKSDDKKTPPAATAADDKTKPDKEKGETTSNTKSVDESVAAGKTELAAEVNSLKTSSFDKFDDKKMKGITAGVNTALGGLESLTDSIKKRDKIGITISVITVLSGIATASGNPIGLAIAIVLNLLKTGINIGKKANEEPGESESKKLEKVIKKSLKEYRETGLKAEWEGYERFSDIFSGNVKMMAEMHEKKDETKEAKDIEENGIKLDAVKQSLFDIIVSRLYDVLMSSTALLGKVQYEISEECNIEIAVPRLKERKILRKDKKEDTLTLKEDETMEEYAKKCLGLYELYGKMNFYREIKFITHLDTVDRLSKNDYTTKSKFLKSVGYSSKATASKVNAMAYKLLILDVIKQMNENNKDVFKPLANAFKNVKMRYLINYLYTHSQKYEYLSKYMEKLDLGEERLKEVMFCKKESLEGSCKKMFDANNQAVVFGIHYRSAFIPEGKKLQISFNDVITEGIQKIGPGTMGNIYYSKDDLTNPVKRYGIQKYEKKDTDRVVTLCSFPKLVENKKIEPLHRVVCTDKEINIKEKLLHEVETKDLQCGSEIDNKKVETTCTYEGKPIALSMNETDIAFMAFRTVVDKSDKITLRWGPYFGPTKMEIGCGSLFWEKLKFYRYKSEAMEEEEQKKITPVTDPESCNGDNNILCQNKVIDKSFFLKICKEQGLKGYCQEIPIIKGQQINRAITIDLTRIGVYIEKNGIDVSSDANVLKTIPRKTSKGAESNKEYDDKVDDCNWFYRNEGKVTNEKMNLLRSMKIPKDMLVELYTDYGGAGERFGPYEGPLTVDRVDGNDNGVGPNAKATFIKSLRYIEKSKPVEESPKQSN